MSGILVLELETSVLEILSGSYLYLNDSDPITGDNGGPSGPVNASDVVVDPSGYSGSFSDDTNQDLFNDDVVAGFSSQQVQITDLRSDVDALGPGIDGEDGASAYEIAVANGFVGTESDWLLSLHGTDGTDGVDLVRRGVLVVTGDPGTVSINVDDYEFVSITGMTGDLDGLIITGTTEDFMQLQIRLRDDGTPRNLAFGGSVVSAGIPLPTTTHASKTLSLGFERDETIGKWCLLALLEET